MRSRTRWTIRGALLLIVSGVALAVAMGVWAGGGAASEPGADGIQESLELQQQEDIAAPLSRPDSSVPLASGVLRSAVERITRGQAAGAGVDVVDENIRVEILHDLPSSEIRAVISDTGGTIEGEIEGLAQALVPFDRLVAVEAHAGVQYVRPPLEANVPLLPPSNPSPIAQGVQGVAVVGEEVAKTNADAWHAAGIQGNGVKVGIIDFFDGGLWNSAVAAGELPTPAGTFCQWNGSPCDIWSGASDHGEGVGEIIHEMAPGAQLYVATVLTITDLQAAVDYFAAQGVDIISRSLTSQYDGPGDGTGDMAVVIDNAVASGMTWFNSAGNSASDGVSGLGLGAYWRRQWVDADNDGLIEFAPGDEHLGFACGFVNGIRWSDFGAVNPTDYDVFVFDTPDDLFPFYFSINDQTTGFQPLEMLDFPCLEGEIDYLQIVLFDTGNGTSGDVLELMVNLGAVEHWQNPYSASGPASDTASPGALSVGAVDPPLGSNIGWYSSQGPTNDERTKPDISAAACVASFTFAPDCFAGTSAAAPAAAGAAALIIDAGLASSPAAVKTYLLNSAVVDRGAVGTDNVFGAGELVLPSPPGSAPSTPTPTPTPTSTAPGPGPTASVTPTLVLPPGNAIKGLSGCTTNELPANDDGSTAAVALPFSPNFFGTTYSSLFVNNNGNVTFDSRLGSFTPFDLNSTSRVIIAPFFGDVDTRGTGSGIVTYGNTTFGGRTTFCANWVNVGYFGSHTDKLNSFQLLLVDRSDVGVGDFDIIFNIDQIQWETGDASGGTNGLGGNSARVGYANGSGTSFELPGSAVNGAFLDSNTATGLIHGSGSSGTAGRYVFAVRGGIPHTTVTPEPTMTLGPPDTPVEIATETPTIMAVATPTNTPTLVPSATVSVGSFTTFVGSEETVSLEVSIDPPGFSAWQIEVNYDPRVTSLASCVALLGGICNPTIDGDTLRVSGGSAVGLHGDIALASLTFQCVAEGTGFLLIKLDILVDPTIGGPQPISATIQNGIGACLSQQAPGDVTCDGLINAVDALFILQFFAGLLANLPCDQNADVDRNGIVDVIDAALILQLSAGFIDSFSVTVERLALYRGIGW